MPAPSNETGAGIQQKTGDVCVGTGGLCSPVVDVIPKSDIKATRRRSIDPPAGRALEILGHAIEYLADEMVHEGGMLCDRDPRVEAIQILMARNREIYFACPLVPNSRERFRTLIRTILFRLHLHRRPEIVGSERDVRPIH